MGLEGASGQPSEQSGKQRVSQEFARANSMQVIEPPPEHWQPAKATGRAHLEKRHEGLSRDIPG